MEQTFSPFGTSYETLPDIKVITASDIIFCTPLHNHVLYFAPKVDSHCCLSLSLFFFLLFFSFFFLLFSSSHLSLGNGLQQGGTVLQSCQLTRAIFSLFRVNFPSSACGAVPLKMGMQTERIAFVDNTGVWNPC